MSSEQRDIRPFGAEASFAGCLDGLRLEMNANHVEPKGRLTVPVQVYVADPAVLLLGETETEASETLERIDRALESAAISKSRRRLDCCCVGGSTQD